MQVALGGRYSRDFFNRHGDLRNIKRLRNWPLDKVLVEKYEFSQEDARELCDFLLPLLDFLPEKRPTAGKCLGHPWLIRNQEPSLLSEPCQHNSDLPVDRSKSIGVKEEAMAKAEEAMGNIVLASRQVGGMQVS